MNKNNRAFTLAEVLITLVIIGVIATIIIPPLFTDYKWKQYKTGVQKVLSNLNQTTKLWYVQKGYNVGCGYLAGTGATKYNFRECFAFYNFYKEVFKITKDCASNAYSNGCIPKYEGVDTVYSAQHPEADSDQVNSAIAGCHYFSQNRILNGKAFVTADGMIFFPYNNGSHGILAVDVNGFKGPNKWGYDIHTFMPEFKNFNSTPKYSPGGCNIFEDGGKLAADLLYKE